MTDNNQQQLSLNGVAVHHNNNNNNLRVIRAVSTAPSSSLSAATTSLLQSSSAIASSHDGSGVVSNHHLAMGQADSNGSVMIPLSAADLDLLRASNVNFSSTGSLLSTASSTTSSDGAGLNSSGTVFTGSLSSSGFVLNGVVDEGGNVLFEAVEPEVNQNHFLHPQSHNHHQHQQQQQQIDHVSAGMHSSSSEINSNGAMDAQGLNLLNLHNQDIVVSSIQPDNAASNGEGSGMTFAGRNVCTSSAAGLIHAISAANRESSNPGSFPTFLPATATAVPGQSTPVDVAVGGQGLQVAFRSTPGGSVDAGNVAQIYLTQNHHHHQQQQQQQREQQQHQILLSHVANIMEEGRLQGSNSIISHTPSVNLHHGRGGVMRAGGVGVQGAASATCNASVNPSPAANFGHNTSSVVTVSLDQQLNEHVDKQQQQQQQLWNQPDQSRLPFSQERRGAGLGLGQLGMVDGGTTSSSLASTSQQQAGQLVAAANVESLSHHAAGGTNVGNTAAFHDMQSQYAGIFPSHSQSQHKNSAYQVAAPSSSSNFGPASPREQTQAYAVIGGDSEATPSESGVNQPQQSQVVVESPAVDSSCVQQGQFTLVYDTGTQVYHLQRVASPSDCTVSQSALSMDGSEAQPTPASVFIPISNPGYGQAQMSHIQASLACGSSSEEVTTSAVPSQLRPGPSGAAPLYNSQGQESEANSTNGPGILKPEMVKSDMDGIPECDTTQEDIETYGNEPTTYVHASNNMDDAEGGLDSTIIQPAMSRSGAAAPPVEVIIDISLDSTNLTPLQAVAMESSREILQTNNGVDEAVTPGHSGNSQESRPTDIPNFFTDDSSAAAPPAKQSVRKSRRLELVAQEARASVKKRSYTSKHYDPALLWCEDCMDAYTDQCPVHRLTAVTDKIVLSRAWASCPNQMQICRLPETQLKEGESPVGVFSKRQIPKFTQFGPFLGVLVDTLESVTRQYFPLMLDLPNKPRQYFETADENQCNWMMFVRPAQTFAEQNLVAYQHKRSVFFSSTKVIEPKQELKVWYAAHYAEQMGVKTLELTTDDIQALDDADGRFACSECSRRFKSWATLQLHLSTHDEEEEEDGDQVAADDKEALLLEYSNAEADGDADFLPGAEGGGNGAGLLSAANTSAAQKQGRGNLLLKGRFRQDKSRAGVNDGTKKRSTFLAKALKKYKRSSQGAKPCSEKVLQNMKGMYRRRGKLSGGNEWMCTHCGLTFDNASLLNLHTLTHAAEDVGMDEIRKLAVPQPVESSSETSASLSTDPTNSIPTAAAAEVTQPACETGAEAEGETKPALMVACPKCNVFFKDHKDLMDHVSTHAQKPLGKDGRPFCCGRCAKSFSSAEKLARHQMVHGDDSAKPLECTICFKRIMNNSAMACHMKKHSDRKYYDCPICDTDFDTAAALREHAQVAHADQNGRYPCMECPKCFDDFGLLKKHVRSFHSNRVFPCPECNKVFPRVDKLRLHMLRHTTHREFMCETCGRQFKRKDKLKEHMKRLHCRERVEQLAGAGGAPATDDKQASGGGAKSSTTKFTPRVMPSEYHRFIYKCHTCLLGFKRRGMLVNHLAKRHPEIRLEQVPELNLPILKTQKDFYCQYCDKIYKSSSKRKVHIQKVHPGCAVPPSTRKKSPVPSSLLTGASDAAVTATGASAAVGAGVGASVVGGFNNSSYSHTVSSITTMPHGCKFCHKQYASKAKLLQHQRKQHPDLAEPRLPSRRKIKKTEPDMLQIAVGGDERFESVLPITVVNQGGDAAAGIQATDLLNLAMSELNYNGGMASLSSLISSLGGGAASAAPAGGGAMVHIQSSSGQLQPATIDLGQLNQALQTFSMTGGQGPGPGVATVLQTPLSPSQHHQQQQLLQQHHHHHHHHQHQHQQQQQISQHQQQQQQLQQHQQQQQQQLVVVESSGSQAGGQFIARAWPANFTAQ